MENNISGIGYTDKNETATGVKYPIKTE